MLHVTKNLSQNRRGLAHFAESSQQNVPVPFSARNVDRPRMTSIVHIRTWYIERAAAAGSDLLAQSLKTEQKTATNWSKRHHPRQLPAVMAVILP